MDTGIDGREGETGKGRGKKGDGEIEMVTRRWLMWKLRMRRRVCEGV